MEWAGVFVAMVGFIVRTPAGRLGLARACLGLFFCLARFLSWPLGAVDDSAGARLLEGVLQLTSCSSPFCQRLTEEGEEAEPSACAQLRTFGLFLASGT